MDKENNNPAGTGQVPTLDEPVLTIPGSGSTAGSNGNKSSSRASSIEALNWSDFEEDETTNEENSQVNSNLLQSIHSSAESTSSSTSKLNGEHHKDETASPSMDKTMTESTLDKAEPFEHLEDLENVIRNRRKDSGTDQMLTSYVSVQSATSDASSAPFDQMSNVPVLDDGPIWSKGMKHYRFEENRIMNQKLTWCVLLSVVLAIGLGLGNLVAYNECEAEHRIIDQQVCAKYDEKPLPTSQTVMPSKATASESAIPVTNTKTPNIGTTSYTSNSEHNYKEQDAILSQPKIPIERIEPTATTQKPMAKKAKPARPMVDPDYKLHAQELSRVLKMLDELSRKIDQFENTTRQLGGIIMMKDEYVKPRSPKSKFLKLLDEVVHDRELEGRKKQATKQDLEEDVNESDSEEANLNAEAEKVLDKIAEAVLNVMNSNLLTKKESPSISNDDVANEETKLETKEVFPLDDDSLFIAHAEVEDKKPKIVDKNNRKFDHSIKNDNGKILEELKPSTLSIMETHKFGEESDLELDYRRGDKRVKTERESSKNYNSMIQDFGEFKEKHKKLPKNKDKSNKSSKTKRSKSKENQSEPKKKSKKQKSKNGHFDSDDNIKHQKRDKRDGSKKVIQDWQASRAKLREENRDKMSAQNRRNKKFTNWQIERDFVREKFREKI